jgi:CheY-like chemotaxis protein
MQKLMFFGSFLNAIQHSDLKNIFNPYFQFPHKNPIDQAASGLGLAINKLIAQAMGGDVDCSSELGKGSTFWFTAWLREGRSLSTSENIPAESSLTRLHAGTSVLLVEDDPINREVALLLLNKVGLKIDWAANGEAALKRANEKSYDLIIIDIQMPIMDGIHATALIRKLPNRKSTPIIAFTANVYDDYRSKCIASGMNDFIEKPVKPNQFYETILRWLPNKLDSFPAFDQDQLNLSIDSEFNRIFMELDQCIEIDFNPVFHRFSKNKSYYVNSLHRFLENHANDPIKIFTHATNSDFVDANLLLSSIKANALTLGLLEIYKATLSIESDMKAGHFVDQSKIDTLISLFLKVANVVHNKPLKFSNRTNSTSKFLHLMTQLREMIINGEYQARLFFSQSNYFLHDLVDTDTYLKLENYLNNFDYDSALLVVDHLLSSSVVSTS